MKNNRKYSKYYKFILYAAVVVLVNVAGLSFFFRFDLTSNNVYSLSKASKDAVEKLTEPLTINVFFTKDLPAPHNNTERFLHDLLEEYAAHSNRYFNYRFYNVSAEEGDISKEAKKNQDLARSYGIYPVQIQNIEQDEVKFKKAYMGMVLIHGDVVDKIPSITSTEGLEYTITSKIEKMNSKIGVLMNLKDPVQIKLYLSSSLDQVATRIRIDDIMSVPAKMEKVVKDLNDKYYGKLEFKYLDPTKDSEAKAQVSDYGLMTLRWSKAADATGTGAAAEESGSAGIVVESGGKSVTMPLINVVRLPLFGTQYQLVDMETLGESLSETIDDVLDINKKIGYMSTRGCLPIAAAPQASGKQTESLDNFEAMVSQEYSMSPVDPAKEIPEGIDCLIIAGPTEKMTDYELFQIDQFLMRGKSVALFLDPYEEIQLPQQQQQMNYNQGPVFRPIDTGLDQLLSFYGAKADRSYVLDENCYEQKLPQMYGGGKQSIYFAPIIKSENIDGSLPYMRNIKALIALMSSPVSLKEDTIKNNGLDGKVLFSSSDRSWEMEGRINLNPMFIQPPTDISQMHKRPLAVMLQGSFPSYFAGKEIPEKPTPGDSAAAGSGAEPSGNAGLAAEAGVEGEGAIIEKGKPGKLFLVGSASILKNNVLDKSGSSTNATFVMNVLDHLNGRDEYAQMRSKMQKFNPLRETSGGVKMFIKTFNIAGLPLLVALFGVLVWVRRKSRKRTIQMMFSK